jgi:hypothetical protein
MLLCFLGYALGMAADLFEESSGRVRPVKELPYIDAGGTQAETATGIRVEENGPVVKLLPKYDERIAYGFVFIVHGAILTSPHIHAICMPRKC